MQPNTQERENGSIRGLAELRGAAYTLVAGGLLHLFASDAVTGNIISSWGVVKHQS